MTVYLSVEDLLFLAGNAAVRDLGLLAAAAARPRATAFGEDAYPNVHTKAAALLHSLAGNHALVDGNKRLAWLATNVFLELNKAAVHFSDNETFSMLREVAQGYITTQELAQRIGQRLGPWPPPGS